MNHYDQIIVAVHGIGSQSRNATVRSVATRFARSIALSDPNFSPLSPQPLGYFHTDVKGAIKVAPLDEFGKNRHTLAGIGFSEVFWADIPEEVDQEKRTLEESKAWARTVVARARAVFYRGWNQLTETQRQGLREPDFGQAGEVLEEIIDTIQVLENLCFLAEKAGVIKINIRQVLEDYLGDVQLVTEFTQYRRDIIGRFHRAMEQIHDQYPNARLHIVAHSEGTVVSFLGMLHAMSSERLQPAEGTSGPALAPVKQPSPWLRQIHGYMTIGSPIDKHILLWPELFERFNLNRAREMFETRARQHAQKNPYEPPDKGIEWRNYYDYGDPVGFELNTARDWLKQQPFNPFHFKHDDKTKHDIGFARYLWPGKAHNDYWEDPDVFEHFLCDVVRPNPDRPPKLPATRPRVAVLSPSIPYVLSFIVLFGGVMLFYRMVAAYINPPLDPMQNYVRYMTLGTTPPESTPLRNLLSSSFLVTLLVAGTTLLSRFPRLIREWKWYGWGVLSFAIGAAAYRIGIAPASGNAIGAFSTAVPVLGNPVDATIALAFVVGLIGLFAVPKSGSVKKSARAAAQNVCEKVGKPKLAWLEEKPNRRMPARRMRFFHKGMRPLISSGAIALLLLVGFQIWQQKQQPSTLSQTEKDTAMRAYLGTNDLTAVPTNSPAWQQANLKLTSVESLIQPHPPLWPVALSGIVFLYLWWLAGLLFDLAFVWQKYIRDSSPLRRFRKCASLPKWSVS